MSLHPRAQVTQPLDQSYRLIPLTKGLVSLVDAIDYETISRWPWYAKWYPQDRKFYAARNIRRDDGSRATLLMHRFILQCENDPAIQVDHIHGNTLDNRRSEIRRATQDQNQWNVGGRGNTSGFKGVSWDKQACRWRAQINLNRKVVNLGRFPTPELAAEAYRRAAIANHGEFVNLTA